MRQIYTDLKICVNRYDPRHLRAIKSLPIVQENNFLDTKYKIKAYYG